MKLDGRRKAGRPKLRWLNCIVNEEIDVCQEMEEASKRQICLAYHSEGNTGEYHRGHVATPQTPVYYNTRTLYHMLQNSVLRS
jgi:hypothetical protein